jgi:hypothetical protein
MYIDILSCRTCNGILFVYDGRAGNITPTATTLLIHKRKGGVKEAT